MSTHADTSTMTTRPDRPSGASRPWWRRLGRGTGEPRPADPVALPAAPHLACHVCGVAVPVGTSPEPITVAVASVEGRPTLPPDPRTGLPRPAAQVTLETCAQCRERQAEAVELLAAFGWDREPRAVARAEVALDALAVLGRPVPEGLTRDGLRALLRHLGRTDGEAGAVRWVSRFSEHLADPDDATRRSPHPWAHVPEETRAALRRAFAAVLAERRAEGAPPVALGPPPITESEARAAHAVEGGCLLCGVAALTVPAAEVIARGGREGAADHLWRAVRADSRTLGGPGSPRPLTGHVCRECAKALEEVGAVGITACERSLHRHLVTVGRDDAARTVREGETAGLVAWGALVHAQHTRDRRPVPPSAERWAHVRTSADRDSEEGR